MKKTTKTSEAQKRATVKYHREHCYSKTIRFREEAFPRERCDLAIKRIQETGVSFNEYIRRTLKEFTKDWGRNKCF